MCPTAADAAGRKRGLVNGLFSIVLEPGRLIDGGGFDDTVAQLTDYVKASPAADPGHEPLDVRVLRDDPGGGLLALDHPVERDPFGGLGRDVDDLSLIHISEPTRTN